MAQPDRNGTIHVDGDTTTITFRRWLPYPVEAVWAAITDPDQLRAWFGEATIDAREGGNVDIIPGPPPAPTEAKRVTGSVLVWDPPHVLEHDWHQRLSRTAWSATN